jgi:Tol biopolymer transport system component
MRREHAIGAICALAVVGVAFVTSCAPSGHEGVFGLQGSVGDRDFMTPKGRARDIDFTADEGTLMSVDVSPDDKWVVFDLLGNIYRVPVGGGDAVELTRGSGIALNYQPRYAPDGERIVFVSDRSGQANIWSMSADGSNVRSVFSDMSNRWYQPTWAPDGQSIYAVKGVASPGRGWERRNCSLWRLPLNGDPPQPVVSDEVEDFFAPSISPDGATLYYHRSVMAAQGIGFQQAGFSIQALNLKSGAVRNISVPSVGVDGQGTQADYWRPIHNYGGEFEPVPSHNGRYLAFARVLKEPQTIRMRRFERSTGLFIYDLQDHSTRRLIAPITLDQTGFIAYFNDATLPPFAWEPDDRHIFISIGGKIMRVDVESGAARVVPFRARVHRQISEQVRARVDLDPDQAVRAKFLRWPSSSPDGRLLAFVGLGRVWLQELDTGRVAPRLLFRQDGDVQLTPIFSPDGSAVLFTSWNAVNRGAVWKADLRSGKVEKLPLPPGEYIYPAWSPDGSVITVLQGRYSGSDASGAELSPSEYWDPSRLAVSMEKRGHRSICGDTRLVCHQRRTGRQFAGRCRHRPISSHLLWQRWFTLLRACK